MVVGMGADMGTLLALPATSRANLPKPIAGGIGKGGATTGGGAKQQQTIVQTTGQQKPDAAYAVAAGSVKNVNPTGSMQNCTNCAYVVDQQLATGARASALPMAQPLPFNQLNSLYNTQMSSWVSRSQIEKSLISFGEGTRAIIYGMDSAGTTAHVWNAVVQNGKINYIDGQLGGSGAFNFKNFPNLRYGITQKGK